MQARYTGIVIHLKPLNAKIGKFFGFIYSPALNHALFFNDLGLQAGFAAPRFGDLVEFSERAANEGSSEKAAAAVGPSHLPVDWNIPLVPLDLVAKLYRHTHGQIRQKLNTKFASAAEAESPLLSLMQVKFIHEWSGQVQQQPNPIAESAQPIPVAKSAQPIPVAKRAARPADEQLRFGWVFNYDSARGICYVQERSEQASIIFAHISAFKAPPAMHACIVFGTEVDQTQRNGIRVSWAEPAQEETDWLFANYKQFSVTALKKLCLLGNEQLTQEVIDWKLNQLGPFNDFSSLQSGLSLLSWLHLVLPDYVPHALHHLTEKAAVLEKLPLWLRYGSLEDAPYYALIVDIIYKESSALSATGMTVSDIAALVELGRHESKLEAVIRAWWPAEKQESVGPSAAVAQCVDLFKWVKQVEMLALPTVFLEANRAELEANRKKFVRGLKQHFAELNYPGTAAAVYQETAIFLPSTGFLVTAGSSLSEATLEELVQEGGSQGILALAELLKRVGKIKGQDTFQRGIKWLRLGEQHLRAHSEFSKQVTACAAACAPVYKLQLYSAGFVQELDWAPLVDQLNEATTYATAVNKANRTGVRMACSRKLLTLYAAKANTFQTRAIVLLKALQAPLKGQGIEPFVYELIKEISQDNAEFAFELWNAGLASELPDSTVLAELVKLGKSNREAKLPDWFARISWERATNLLELVVKADEQYFLRLRGTMLFPWLATVLKGPAFDSHPAQVSIKAALLATKRQELVVPLMVRGILACPSPNTFVAVLDNDELEALLDAPAPAIRQWAAHLLLQRLPESPNCNDVDKSCLRIIGRLLKRNLKAAHSTTPVNSVISKTLGSIFQDDDGWHLCGYGQTIGMWLPNVVEVLSRSSAAIPINTANFKKLISLAISIGSSALPLRIWKKGVVSEMPDSSLYEVLTHLETTEATAFDVAALINSLSSSQRLDMLAWAVDNKLTQRLSSWRKKTLVEWVGGLSDTEQSRDVWARLISSANSPTLLTLWLANVSEHYDFEAYRLLVFTLQPADQHLFLRKTFKLLAEGELQLTAGQLNSIVRYGRDELAGENVLDYSLDLVLNTLVLLAEQNKYPEEQDIMGGIYRYIKQDATVLEPIGKTLFASCLGRAGFDKEYTSEKTVIKARVNGTYYERSRENNTIIVNGEELSVADGTIQINGQIHRISWGTSPGYNYIPGKNNPKWIPKGITLCEGRLANKADDTTGLPFWWCCGRGCFKPNQHTLDNSDWQKFTLVDFINVLGLPNDSDRLFAFAGLINRVNRILKHLQCRSCNHILQPADQSDFNFYRTTNFKCSNPSCEKKADIIYLSHCLNGRCMDVIDSRDTCRCSFSVDGHAALQGMYICTTCGGCCSKQGLIQRKENLERTNRPEILRSHWQYADIRFKLEHKLYHWERMQTFCYKCAQPMTHEDAQDDYSCLTCNTVYRRGVAHVEQAKRKNLVENEDAFNQHP